MHRVHTVLTDFREGGIDGIDFVLVENVSRLELIKEPM